MPPQRARESAPQWRPPAPSCALRAPFRLDGAFLLELEKSGIQRAVIQGEQIATGLLDAPRDAVPMLRAHAFQRFQHHQGQRALPDIGLVSHRRSSW